jgi:hypothetical protein
MPMLTGRAPWRRIMMMMRKKSRGLRARSERQPQCRRRAPHSTGARLAAAADADALVDGGRGLRQGGDDRFLPHGREGRG